MVEAGGGAKTFFPRPAVGILAVTPERIRYWVKRNLVRPLNSGGRKYRFAFNDLLEMRMAKELLGSRQHINPIQRCIERVRALVDPDRSVTSLKLVNDEGRIIVRDGPSLIEAETGQLLLDFDRSYQPGKVEDGFGPARVRERFEEARRVADEDPLRALTIYSELVGREPANFEAHLRLATLLEREGDLGGALRHLLGAAAIVPASADVHLKLGLLYRKKCEHQTAPRSFLRTLACDPANVEAHRTAAEMYETMGRKHDSQRHLSAIHRLIKGD